MRTFDFATLPPRRIYELMIEAIVPRPIALVSTHNRKGQLNLAPFSFFNGVSSSPPCVSLAITAPRGTLPKPPAGDPNSQKHTLRNIVETGDFVVNSANHWFLTQLNQTSADYPYGVSEFAMTGLTPLASTKVGPPRVAEAAWSMECKLLQTVPVGEGPGSATLVIGQIVAMHVQDKVLTHEKIDITALDPISRLGGHLYGRTRDVIELTRPQAIKL